MSFKDLNVSANVLAVNLELTCLYLKGERGGGGRVGKVGARAIFKKNRKEKI